MILSIGPLSRFDDGLPDYVERLKKSFKAGQPLIPSLLPYCEKEAPAEVYRFSINEGSPDCFGHPRLFSHLLLERILEELGLNFFFSSYKGFTKLEYDVYGFATLLIFGRLLNPTTKSATVRQNNDYYEPILAEALIRTMFTIPWTLSLPTRIRSSAASTQIWSKRLDALRRLFIMMFQISIVRLKIPMRISWMRKEMSLKKVSEKMASAKKNASFPLYRWGSLWMTMVFPLP